MAPPSIASVLSLTLIPALALSQVEKASFTVYGSGDQNGSPNCRTATPACGAGTQNDPGYTAAISQQQFGVGPGAGAGPACGTCYKLTLQTDQNGSPEPSNTITVTVNNLCPAQGNEAWCEIGANGTNSHGANVHFDLCLDSGAQPFLNGDGDGLGTAEEVPCGSSPSSSSPSTTSTLTPSSTAAGSSLGSSTSSAEVQETSVPAFSYTSSLPYFSAPAPSSLGAGQGATPTPIPYSPHYPHYPHLRFHRPGVQVSP